MSRDPSIHIKESDLIKLLKGIIPNEGDIKKLLDKAKSYSANSRGILVSNDKLLKKSNKVTLSGRNDTSIFAQTLFLVRQQMKHRGIRLIKVGDTDWLNLKEACKLATEFCNEFQIEIKQGYKEYITLGLRKMKNFSIFKFKTLHGAICNEFEAMQVIERDRTPSKTEECHSIYLANIADKIGYSKGYKDYPEKYQYFIKAKEEANKFGVSCKVYIAAQFSGFEWANSIPDPMQLVGPKSIERLQKYAFENNIKLGDRSTIIDFKKLKRHGRNNH